MMLEEREVTIEPHAAFFQRNYRCGSSRDILCGSLDSGERPIRVLASIFKFIGKIH